MNDLRYLITLEQKKRGIKVRRRLAVGQDRIVEEEIVEEQAR